MKILKSEVLYQGRLRAVRHYIENEEGRCYTHETIEHPGAVVILPIKDDGTIVCVRQYRCSIGKEILELPAGTLEKDEPPIECARREIMEEIGMAARTMVPAGMLYPAPGFCDEEQHLFIAQDLYPQTAPQDEDEDITVVNLTVSEFEEAVRSGILNDAKSLALFMRARLLGIV